MENGIDNTAELWVQKYKPNRYLDLLSDESTNRMLLHWLKLWDKVVFNKEINKKRKATTDVYDKSAGIFLITYIIYNMYIIFSDINNEDDISFYLIEWYKFLNPSVVASAHYGLVVAVPIN